MQFDVPHEQVSVTVKQAAALTGLSEATVREAIRRLDLHAKRIGVRILIPVDALRAWVDSLPDAFE